jgi:hypothetical protein
MKGYCPFNAFSDLFGNVGQREKYLNVVGLDNIMAILGAVLLTYLFDIPFPLSIIGIYTVGILIHMLFGVKTKTIVYLGISC